MNNRYPGGSVIVASLLPSPSLNLTSNSTVLPCLAVEGGVICSLELRYSPGLGLVTLVSTSHPISPSTWTLTYGRVGNFLPEQLLVKL